MNSKQTVNTEPVSAPDPRSYRVFRFCSVIIASGAGDRVVGQTRWIAGELTSEISRNS